MVLAILDGQKTQTRRTIRGITWIANTAKGVDPYWRFENTAGGGEFSPSLVECGECKCPYGQSGDRLWVRESHFRWGRWVRNGKTKKGKQAWKFRPAAPNLKKVLYVAGEPVALPEKIKRTELAWHKRPSIFMPRWASRITLEIVSVRVERVQEITDKDAKAEGCSQNSHYVDTGLPGGFISMYHNLWNSLNAKRGFSWESNCYVWVLEFKQL